jgi:hypothetical protein
MISTSYRSTIMAAPPHRQKPPPPAARKRPITRAYARLLVARVAVSELRHHVDNGSEWLWHDLDGSEFSGTEHLKMRRELEDLCDMLERRAERIELAQKRRAQQRKP